MCGIHQVEVWCSQHLKPEQGKRIVHIFDVSIEFPFLLIVIASNVARKLLNKLDATQTGMGRCYANTMLGGCEFTGDLWTYLDTTESNPWACVGVPAGYLPILVCFCGVPILCAIACSS